MTDATVPTARPDKDALIFMLGVDDLLEKAFEALGLQPPKNKNFNEEAASAMTCISRACLPVIGRF